MAFDFLKKIFKAKEVEIEKNKNLQNENKKEEIIKTEETKNVNKEQVFEKEKIEERIENKISSEKPKEKPISEKTDEELIDELNKISPEILAQAKTPEMKKMIVNIYRKMLEDNVNINDEREVKKWLKKHPELSQGGEVQKVETYKRPEPKIGRNDPCPCGSGKKYKKCCGKDK